MHAAPSADVLHRHPSELAPGVTIQYVDQGHAKASVMLNGKSVSMSIASFSKYARYALTFTCVMWFSKVEFAPKRCPQRADVVWTGKLAGSASYKRQLQASKLSGMLHLEHNLGRQKKAA